MIRKQHYLHFVDDQETASGTLQILLLYMASHRQLRWQIRDGVDCWTDFHYGNKTKKMQKSKLSEEMAKALTTEGTQQATHISCNE